MGNLLYQCRSCVQVRIAVPQRLLIPASQCLECTQKQNSRQGTVRSGLFPRIQSNIDGLDSQNELASGLLQKLRRVHGISECGKPNGIQAEVEWLFWLNVLAERAEELEVTSGRSGILENMCLQEEVDRAVIYWWYNGS